MPRADANDTDAAILERVIRPNQAGRLTAAERRTLDSYRRVGWFLDLLGSKARQSLRRGD